MAFSRKEAAQYIAREMEKSARGKVAKIPHNLIGQHLYNGKPIHYLGGGITFYFHKIKDYFFVNMAIMDASWNCYIEFDTHKEHKFKDYYRIPISRKVILLNDASETAAIDRQLEAVFLAVQQIIIHTLIVRGVLGRWYSVELARRLEEWTNSDPSLTMNLTQVGQPTEDLTVSVWGETRTEQISGTEEHGITKLMEDEGEAIIFSEEAFGVWQSWVASVKKARAQGAK